MTFTPLTPWPGDTLIAVSVSGVVRDLAGNGKQFFSSSFRTAAVADTTPPAVLSVVPAHGTTDVGPRADVVLTFSESLNASTVSNTTFGLFVNDDWLSTSVLRSADNRTVTLSTTLPAGSVITVVATGEVTDLSGNHLPDFLSSFTTAATPETGRPSIVRQRPGSGVSGVRGDTPIVLYVDEPLDPPPWRTPCSWPRTGFWSAARPWSAAAGRRSPSRRTPPFAAGAHVEIFVEPTATDLTGNLIMRYQGTYNVAVDPATTPPTLVRTNPDNGALAPRNVRIELEFNEALLRARSMPARSSCARTAARLSQPRSPSSAADVSSGSHRRLNLRPTPSIAIR